MLHARVVRVSENVADGCSVRSETADTRNAAIRRGSGEDKRKATIEIASACWRVTALRDGITREHLTTGGVNKPDSRRIYDVVGISLRTGRRGDLRQTAPASIWAGRRQAGGRKRRGKGSVRESSVVVDIAKVRRSRAVVCREFSNERLWESVGIQPREIEDIGSTGYNGGHWGAAYGRILKDKVAAAGGKLRSSRRFIDQ